MELRYIGGKNIIDYSLVEAYELAQYIKSNNIYVSAIDTPIGKRKHNFSKAVKMLIHALELANIFDTHYVRIFSDVDYSESNIQDALQEMTILAKQYKKILLLENEVNTYASNPNACKSLLDYCNSPFLKLLFDPGNFFICGFHCIESYNSLKPYTEYIHLKDVSSYEGGYIYRMLGDGELHLGELLDEIQHDNPDGYISFEPHLAEGCDEIKRISLFREFLLKFNQDFYIK